VLQGEVFVFEFFPVNGFSSSAVVVCKITTLAHEIGDDPVESGSFVAESFFAGTKSAEVFGGLWYYVRP